MSQMTLTNKPGGLVNTGTSCSFNTLVHCLAACHELIKRLRKLCQISHSSDRNPHIFIVEQLLDVIDKTWGQGHVVRPNGLLHAIANTLPSDLINVDEQNDFHELVLLILDSIGQAASLENSNSDVEKAFKGMTRSSIICNNCGAATRTSDEFVTLNISFKQDYEGSSSRTRREPESVMEMIQNSWQSTEITDRTCDSCQKKGNATQCLSHVYLPEVLIVVIKRYNNNRKLSKRIDVKHEIDFASQTNGPRVTCVNDTKATMSYHLAAIANHSGGRRSGHYYAVCNHPVTNEWFRLNDDKVDQISDMDKWTHKDDYVLFYKRTSA